MSIYNSNKNFYSIVGSAVNSIINEKGNNLLESSDKYTIFKQKRLQKWSKLCNAFRRI